MLLVRGVDALAEPGFPVYAREHGAWVRTDSDHWAAGFGPGLGWLARHEGLTSRAVPVPRPRGPVRAFQSFVGWYGAHLGGRLVDEPGARDVAGSIGVALAEAMHDNGALAVGEPDLQPERAGSLNAYVDAVGPTTALVAGYWNPAGGSDHLDRVGRHASWTLTSLQREDGSVAQVVEFDHSSGVVLGVRTSGQGLHPGSRWTRGQAWALLAAGMASPWTAGTRWDLGEFARRLVDHWLGATPRDDLPPWDLDLPVGRRGEVDSSAAAIAATGLMWLAAYESDAADARRLRDAAYRSVAVLLRHLKRTGSRGQRPSGTLEHGCYRAPSGLATDHELIWGDYFLAEAVLLLTGRLTVDDLLP